MSFGKNPRVVDAIAKSVGKVRDEVRDGEEVAEKTRRSETTAGKKIGARKRKGDRRAGEERCQVVLSVV